MSIFTRYAMDALMKTTHPEVNRKQCWNLHPHRTPCTACKDICPYGDEIFTRPNLVKDWDPCTDCGLCVSACRSGCIAPSPEQVQRDISPADSDGDTIWIGCERSTRKNTVVRTCVSAYSWEALAYLALNKKIVLDLTPCGECENDVCAEHLRAVLTRLVEFFGQPLFEARFTLAYELDDAPFHVKEYSRREMMEQVTSGSKKGTKQLLRMLPGLRSEDESSQDFRLLLHQYTKQLKAVSETPLRYGYHLPNFTPKCFACGRCEKSCRSGAIKFEDLPDGQTRAVITPWKCSECGVCVAACSNGGLDGSCASSPALALSVSTSAPRPSARNAASPLRPTVRTASVLSAASSCAPKSVRRRLWLVPRSVRPSARPKRLQKQLQRSWLPRCSPLSQRKAPLPLKQEPLPPRPKAPADRWTSPGLRMDGEVFIDAAPKKCYNSS